MYATDCCVCNTIKNISIMCDEVNKSGMYFRDLRLIFAKVLEIKNKGHKVEEISNKRKYVSLLFVFVKKSGRLIKYKVRSGREELHQQKVHLDSKRLHLQNLLYEVKYLKREIRHCCQFKSQDEDIEPLTEYFLLNPIGDAVCEHTKRLVRLQLELNLRKKLSTYSRELMHSKKQVLKDILLKTENLTSFAPSLRTLFEATRPIQNSLKVPICSEWVLGHLVQLLPQPLYVAYMYVYGFVTSVATEDISVEVTGSEDVYQSELEMHSPIFKNGGGISKNKYVSNSISNLCETNLEELRMRVLEPHPLILRITFGNVLNADEYIGINLHFFGRLGFVTASTVINLKESDGISREIISSQKILTYVIENDCGNIIPVASADYELTRINMTSEECLQYLHAKKFGKPYRWLQRMCSIEVFEKDETQRAETKLLQIIPNILKSINYVWNTRLNLMKQINALVNMDIEFYLKQESYAITQPSCSLVQWTSVSWDEYVGHNSTARYIYANLVDATNYFYRAVVVRGSAKMECLVSISQKFPSQSSLWIVCVYWNGEHNSLNNAAIKMMEYWTNSLVQDQLEENVGLISCQLLRTMCSFDIFLETEGLLYSPLEYNKEKPYIKAYSKRMRARPYRYIEGGTSISFKQ